MSDILDEATEALREETGADRNPETLVRVLAARRRGKVRSLRWLVWPLAATLLVLSALAGASGRLGRVLAVIGFDRAAPETGASGGSSTPVRAAPVSGPAKAPSADQAPSSPISPAAPTASLELPSARPNARTDARPGAPAAIAPLPSASAAKESADELYRRASQAHFVDHDYARAIGLWDRYLASEGPLALEARYNRAVALLRAGRTGEARAALAPFAAGEYGAYRKQEAQALLDALPPRQGPAHE